MKRSPIQSRDENVEASHPVSISNESAATGETSAFFDRVRSPGVSAPAHPLPRRPSRTAHGTTPPPDVLGRGHASETSARVSPAPNADSGELAAGGEKVFVIDYAEEDLDVDYEALSFEAGDDARDFDDQPTFDLHRSELQAVARGYLPLPPPRAADGASAEPRANWSFTPAPVAGTAVASPRASSALVGNIQKTSGAAPKAAPSPIEAQPPLSPERARVANAFSVEHKRPAGLLVLLALVGLAGLMLALLLLR